VYQFCTAKTDFIMSVILHADFVHAAQAALDGQRFQVAQYPLILRSGGESKAAH